jgi:hypothetical protein
MEAISLRFFLNKPHFLSLTQHMFILIQTLQKVYRNYILVHSLQTELKKEALKYNTLHTVPIKIHKIIEKF